MKIKKTTTFSKRKQDVKRQWLLIDAKDKILGRLASEVAILLTGKHKSDYTPHIDGGDYVVIINAAQVKVTRGKEMKKIYVRHSNYPGGMRRETFADALKRNPSKVILAAVKGMLANNRLRDGRLGRLKIFANEKHTYQNFIKK
jgi:large subunit ribosomal protein L13